MSSEEPAKPRHARPRPEFRYQIPLVIGFFASWALITPYYPLWFREALIPIILFAVGMSVSGILSRFLGWRDSNPRLEPIVAGLSDGIGLAALLIVIVAFYGHIPISFPF